MIILKIFINPGHSPNGIPDPGAGGFGLRECDIVLNIAKRLENYLINAGFEVATLQVDTPSNTFSEIVDPANDWQADLFISIHCNAFNGVAHGTETYYFGSSAGKKLAESIQKHLITSLGTFDRGVREYAYAVLRKTNMPAVLVETAFIDNESDNKLLANRENDFAKAIADGVCDYCGVKSPTVEIKEVEIEVPASNNVDIEKVAILARKYESNGDPACVANNPGDLGGVSYGLYQFASNVGVVDHFVKWLCNYPDNALANYGRVLAKYKVNSQGFIDQWKELGTIDAGNFGKLQDEYIKIQYYDTAANRLLKEYFDLNKHTDALKAVVLSRSVQNGPGGCVKLFKIAADKRGQPNLSYVDNSYFDGDIINAIYDFLIVECDLSKPDSQGIWRSPDDFCHGSKSIIYALRSRFIRERSDALSILTGNSNI